MHDKQAGESRRDLIATDRLKRFEKDQVADVFRYRLRPASWGMRRSRPPRRQRARHRYRRPWLSACRVPPRCDSAPSSRGGVAGMQLHFAPTDSRIDAVAVVLDLMGRAIATLLASKDWFACSCYDRSLAILVEGLISRCRTLNRDRRDYSFDCAKACRKLPRLPSRLGWQSEQTSRPWYIGQTGSSR